MLGSKLLRRVRAPYEGVELGHYYPEPWPVNRSTTLQFWWRFWLGRPMDNEIRTNATFWRSATSGYPSRWARLAGWQRLALRLAGVWSVLVVLPLIVLTVVSISLGWSGWRGTLPMLTELSLLPLLVPPGVLMVRSLIRERGLVLPMWEHRKRAGAERERSRFYERWAYAPCTLIEGSREWERSVVLPLARALAPQLHRPYHPDTARDWVSVPRDYAQAGAQPVEIRVPAGFTGADHQAMARLVRTVSQRLAAGDLMARWELQGEHPRVLLSAPPAPPKLVTYADIAHLLPSEEYRPLLGVTAGGQGLNAEMVQDSPHVGMSAGPGSGKTTEAAFIAAQALSWGWEVVVLDWKCSAGWGLLRQLPGVRYITDLEAIHAFGEHLQTEIDIRRDNLLNGRGLAGRKKLLIIRDEWNATADLLMSYWQNFRASEPDPELRRMIPPKSPALIGYSQLDFAGREFGLHDLCIAQRFSARVFNGNADIRECFQIRMLARYTEQTKKMLVGNMKPFPKKSNHPGRWTVVAGEDVSVVQGPLLTADELRLIAESGHRGAEAAPEVDSAQGNPLTHESTQAVRPEAVQPERPALEAPSVKLASLSSLAVTLEPYGITKKVLQNERSRDAAFPQAVSGDQFNGYLYDVDQVTKWAKARHARMAAEKGSK